LALGALLGLFDVGTIHEEVFSLGDAQLPGFMYANLPSIEEQNSAGNS
jgi:hypothetical protein